MQRPRRFRIDPWVGKIPEEGNDDSLKYSFLGNPMNRRAGWATVHGMQRVIIEHTHMHVAKWLPQKGKRSPIRNYFYIVRKERENKLNSALAEQKN